MVSARRSCEAWRRRGSSARGRRAPDHSRHAPIGRDNPSAANPCAALPTAALSNPGRKAVKHCADESPGGSNTLHLRDGVQRMCVGFEVGAPDARNCSTDRMTRQRKVRVLIGISHAFLRGGTQRKSPVSSVEDTGDSDCQPETRAATGLDDVLEPGASVAAGHQAGRPSAAFAYSS